jgi:hypothetical protein
VVIPGGAAGDHGAPPTIQTPLLPSYEHPDTDSNSEFLIDFLSDTLLKQNA